MTTADTTKRRRGRPKASDPSDVQVTVSVRVKPKVREALEKMAAKEHRKHTDMARIILIKRLIAEKLLPEDFDF